MSTVASYAPSLPNVDSPIRTIALERLKLNVPVLVAFYVWIHSDFYTYILKKSLGIRLMQTILKIWDVGQDQRLRSVTSEVARRERANGAFEWVFETPIYAILIWNIVQALYAMYTNSTSTQLLQPESKEKTAPAPLSTPAPGPNPSTRVRASLTRSLPDSPMSHPSFPVTMSSDSLRRRLAQQTETKSSEQPQNKQITTPGENEKGQTSQPNSSRQPEQATPSRLPLSRLLQRQSQLSASQTLGLLAPSPSLSNSYLSRSGAESLTTTGFSLPTPARTLDDEDFGSLRASSSRRYQGSINKDLGGVSADALQSYRARHPEGGSLGRSTAGSAVDRVRALSGLKRSGEENIAQGEDHNGSQGQMVAA